MKLTIAGGCGEHGRNCFMPEWDRYAALVDCGIMTGHSDSHYPRLSERQISALRCVFLTHSHADHTGALPWLANMGYHGPIIATRETLSQLPFSVQNTILLQDICPGGSGNFQGLHIKWGRSGHCEGSVWLRMERDGQSLFFSGDYTESTRVYACDKPDGEQADLAVLDCAYGSAEIPYNTACFHIVDETRRALDRKIPVLFPVPKYGRGIELLSLLFSNFPDVPYYGDNFLIKNLEIAKQGGFWYHKAVFPSQVFSPVNGDHRGIYFVSSPQLDTTATAEVGETILSEGGIILLTGTVDRGSLAERMLRTGRARQLRYPVHLGESEYGTVEKRNRFDRVIPYHCAELKVESEIAV